MRIPVSCRVEGGGWAKRPPLNKNHYNSEMLGKFGYMVVKPLVSIKSFNRIKFTLAYRIFKNSILAGRFALYVG